jgi:hypothetical protein
MGLVQKNLGKSKFLSLGFYTPIKISEWYSLSINTQAAWNKDDTYHSGERFQNDYITANTNLQHTFTIMPTMRASIQMMWAKRGWEGISHFDDIWYVNAQIEKSFFERRLNLTLSCNDLFSSLVYSGKINFGKINQTFKEDQNLRRIVLTVRYNFGSQQIRGSRYHGVGIDEEIGRTR